MNISGHKISVRDLSNILAALNQDFVLEPNSVGNLVITDKGVYIGYIDLLPCNHGIHMLEEK